MKREIHIKDEDQLKQIFKLHFEVTPAKKIYYNSIYDGLAPKLGARFALTTTFTSIAVGIFSVPASMFILSSNGNILLNAAIGLGFSTIAGLTGGIENQFRIDSEMIEFYGKADSLEITSQFNPLHFKFFQDAYLSYKTGASFIGNTDFLPTSEMFSNAILPIRELTPAIIRKSIESPVNTVIKPKTEMISVHVLQLIIDRVSSENAKMEMDIVEILKNPVIFDMSFPATKKFMILMSQANTQNPGKGMVESDGVFAKTVHELEFSWNFLKSESSRLRLSNFSIDERQKVERAQKLLSIALDNVVTPNERRIAYTRAVKELEGVINVPSKALIALESGTGLLALESSP